ncbi:MAG: nucleotidyltransferase family protein [Candidatus Margulisiibacteriota bacterium]
MWPNKHQIELLKAGLFPPEVAVGHWQNWEAVYQNRYETIDHASAGLIPLALRNTEKQLPQTPFVKRCKGVYRQTWTHNQLLWLGIQPVIAFLEKSNIPYAFLKGMYMIREEYQDFGCRRLGDVDILISKAHFDFTVLQLKRLGFESEDSHKVMQGSRHAALLKNKANLNLDLHVRLFNQLPIEVGPGALTPEMRLFHTIVHGLKPSRVSGIRWIADAVTLISHHPIDWDALCHTAIQAKAAYQLYKGLAFLKTDFFAPVPQTTLAQLLAATHRLEKVEYLLWVLFQPLGTGVVAGWIRDRLNDPEAKRSFRQYMHQVRGIRIRQVIRGRSQGDRGKVVK